MPSTAEPQTEPPAAVAVAPPKRLPPLSPPVEIPVPPRPDDPRAQKAYVAIEAYCARCHQAGKSEQPLPSGRLANVLSLDEMSRNARYVWPGVPDASRLYEIFITRHAPLDVYGRAAGEEPRPDDIEAVRDWIKDLPAGVQKCTERKPLTFADVEAHVREAQRLERDGAKNLRFFSLAHLYNACATTAELAAYRQALTKVLNGLSWAAEPATLMPVGDEGAIVAFRLNDVGWVPQHWDQIQRAYPKSLFVNIADDVKKGAGAYLPIVKGDWFAAAASEPPLYYALLGLPAKLAELAKMNGVDIDQNIRTGRARRVAIRTSDITRGNRLVERHPGGRGGFWMAYDFATSTGEQDIFERPLGPKATPQTKSVFKPDAVRVLFALPNGFYAYALYDASGNRIDRVLPGIEKLYAGVEGTALEPSTRAGSNCFACHTEGIKPVRDEFRAHAAGEAASLQKEVREAALALATSDSELMLLMEADSERYRAALAVSGIDAKLRIGGEELVTGLARRYRGDVDLKQAIAETGLDRETFLSALDKVPADVQPLVRRLQTSVIDRADVERLLTYLKGLPPPPPMLSGGGFLREAKAAIELKLWLDKSRLRSGDLVTINAEADSDCFLTLVSVDGAGKATVIYPNDFEADNLIQAGKPVAVPGPTAPYQLRFKADGTETLLGQCSTSSAPPTGIEHDFVRQRFTVLGNWENFIRDVLVTDSDLRNDPEKAERARKAKAEALRRRREQGERTEERPDIITSEPLQDGRAVLVIDAS